MKEALKLAREIIKATNASSQFWLVPDSNLNKAITSIEAALAQPEQNLNCKSVQARLATAWGYVKAEQEPVALQDDEIYDAAFSAYCRGENSRELFRIMWSNRLTCSIGWDRDELKSFARNIAAIYIHSREKNNDSATP